MPCNGSSVQLVGISGILSSRRKATPTSALNDPKREEVSLDISYILMNDEVSYQIDLNSQRSNQFPRFLDNTSQKSRQNLIIPQLNAEIRRDSNHVTYN